MRIVLKASAAGQPKAQMNKCQPTHLDESYIFLERSFGIDKRRVMISEEKVALRPCGEAMAPL
jgi:hypothetical protein